MASRGRKDAEKQVESYEHRDKERVNNPPAGLVTPETDPDTGQSKKTYADDPLVAAPYGIQYGSNFQPFVNKRDVKDRKDEDLTADPAQFCACGDTWELGIYSDLTYLRDRQLLAREL